MAQSIIRTKPIDAIIVHHTVKPEQSWSQAQTMANLNSSKLAYDGKSPYHRVGGHNWDTIGRPDNTVGYHSGSSTVTNNQAIGVALTGNFNNDTPTEYQRLWLGRTLRELMKKYNVPRHRVFLHKEVRDSPTACPGAKITHAFLDQAMRDSDTIGDMPQDQLSDHIVDGMPADQRIEALKDQVRRYKDEIRKRDEIINHPDDGIGALQAKIEELKKQIAQGGDNAEAAQQLAKAKAAHKALGEALA